MLKEVISGDIFADLNCETLYWTRHALLRISQRNYNIHEVAYVVSFGRLFYRNGRRFYFLGSKDIPLAHKNSAQAFRLVGTTVLLDSLEERIVTVYKDQEGLRQIKKMPRFRKAGEITWKRPLLAA